MEVRIRVHKQVNALRIYDTIWKKVKGGLFLFFLFLQCRRRDLNREPLVQTTSVLNHTTTLPPQHTNCYNGAFRGVKAKICKNSHLMSKTKLRAREWGGGGLNLHSILKFSRFSMMKFCYIKCKLKNCNVGLIFHASDEYILWNFHFSWRFLALRIKLLINDNCSQPPLSTLFSYYKINVSQFCVWEFQSCTLFNKWHKNSYRFHNLL
jgi:hypothetical protein